MARAPSAFFVCGVFILGGGRRLIVYGRSGALPIGARGSRTENSTCWRKSSRACPLPQTSAGADIMLMVKQKDAALVVAQAQPHSIASALPPDVAWTQSALSLTIRFLPQD